MRVVFFHRKPRPNYNFSVENLFQQVREALPKEVEWKLFVVRYYSEGFFKRLYIGLQCAFHQGDINHVTGDINFIALFLSRRKTVLTILDLGLMNHPRKIARAILRLFWIVLPVKRASLITAISEATKLELLKFVRVHPDKIRVVYVPIQSHFLPAPKIFNKEMPRILQIGTKFNKNVIRLVKSLKGLPCVLDIVGEVESELERALRQSGITYVSSKNISNVEVVEKYEACDILSFVSTYEGFGMPIVEANAIGRVVVTSNVLSMPEVAGNSAHLVDPYDIGSIRDGILKVIEDDEYREQLIQNGFENKKRFDEKEIAKQYAAIYNELIH